MRVCVCACVCARVCACVCAHVCVCVCVCVHCACERQEGTGNDERKERDNIVLSYFTIASISFNNKARGTRS